MNYSRAEQESCLTGREISTLGIVTERWKPSLWRKKMRLIDAEQLKQAVRKKFPALPDRCKINELVNAAPTVEIVHCCECKYWYAEIGASTGWLPCQEIVTERDWFCGSGKRRENNGCGE